MLEFFELEARFPHQQNVSRFDSTVLLLRARSNAHEDLAPLMYRVNE